MYQSIVFDACRNDLEQQQLLCSSYCISLLLRFYDLNNVGDRARLATVCRALMSAATAGVWLAVLLWFGQLPAANTFARPE